MVALADFFVVAIFFWLLTNRSIEQTKKLILSFKCLHVAILHSINYLHKNLLSLEIKWLMQKISEIIDSILSIKKEHFESKSWNQFETFCKKVIFYEIWRFLSLKKYCLLWHTSLAYDFIFFCSGSCHLMTSFCDTKIFQTNRKRINAN